MTDFVEITVEARDAQGNVARQELEYKPSGKTVDHAVHEIMEVIGEAAGSERLREVNTSR
jgi:hypothetical protein